MGKLRRYLPVIAAVILVAMPVVWAAANWQQGEERQAVSTGNLRRLANGLFLYTQDWDGRPMPPAVPLADGAWHTWADSLRPYTEAKSFDSPVNPLSPALRDPVQGYSINAAYALNRRFWNTFGRGTYPLDNLELPECTALFVEAGAMQRNPVEMPTRPGDKSETALMTYGDMADRVNGFSPYPSAHDGKIGVVAADGHVELLHAEHYAPAPGTHDPLYGRIGGNIYNWNGGYPSGMTDTPPRE